MMDTYATSSSEMCVPESDQPLPLHGLCICVTGVSGAEERDIRGYCAVLGATFDTNLKSDQATNNTTHLIIKRVGSMKYSAAKKKGIPTVTLGWLKACFDRSDLVPCDAYRTGPLTGLTICATQISQEQRSEVQRHVEATGGIFHRDLQEGVVTHLLALTPEGEKYKAAKAWKMNVVSPDWLADCLDAGKWVAEQPYMIVKPTKAQSKGAGMGSAGNEVYASVQEAKKAAMEKALCMYASLPAPPGVVIAFSSSSRGVANSKAAAAAVGTGASTTVRRAAADDDDAGTQAPLSGESTMPSAMDTGADADVQASSGREARKDKTDSHSASAAAPDVWHWCDLPHPSEIASMAPLANETVYCIGFSKSHIDYLTTLCVLGGAVRSPFISYGVTKVIVGSDYAIDQNILLQLVAPDGPAACATCVKVEWLVEAVSPGFFQKLSAVRREKEEEADTRAAAAARAEVEAAAAALLMKQKQGVAQNASAEAQAQASSSSKSKSAEEDSQSITALTRQLLTNKPRPTRRLSSGLSRRTSVTSNAEPGAGASENGDGSSGVLSSGDMALSAASARVLKRRESSRSGGAAGAKRPSLPAVDWPAYASEPGDADAGGQGVNEDCNPQTANDYGAGTPARPRKMSKTNHSIDDGESQWVVYD